MDENSASLGFLLFDGIGPRSFQKLLKKFGSSENAWENLDHATAKELRIQEKVYLEFENFRHAFDSQEYFEKLKKTKVVFIPFENSEYPSQLKDLDAPPIGLFCKGNLGLLALKNNLAVVGARKITSYGKEVTVSIVTELARNHIVITSGLALGVDAAAHKTALENNTPTIAVLGCGVDCATPSENQDLYEKILDNNGLVVSEYPLGMPPSKGSFPMRNRIIAALSLGVLITEAAEDSGSLITAEEALKLGRKVFAIPGPITSQMSRGSLKLLKEGGMLVTNAEDILQELKIQNAKLKIEIKKLENLNAEEKKVVELLENENLDLDTISKNTKIPIHKLLGIVTGLELRGILKNSGGEVSIV